jgi:hypothetical protein
MKSTKNHGICTESALCYFKLCENCKIEEQEQAPFVAPVVELRRPGLNLVEDTSFLGGQGSSSSSSDHSNPVQKLNNNKVQ